ncbi:hypothetical protein EJB05_22606, partial [Eragrostis curvula]
MRPPPPFSLLLGHGALAVPTTLLPRRTPPLPPHFSTHCPGEAFASISWRKQPSSQICLRQSCVRNSVLVLLLPDCNQADELMPLAASSPPSCRQGSLCFHHGDRKETSGDRSKHGLIFDYKSKPSIV